MYIINNPLNFSSSKRRPSLFLTGMESVHVIIKSESTLCPWKHGFMYLVSFGPPTELMKNTTTQDLVESVVRTVSCKYTLYFYHVN